MRRLASIVGAYSVVILSTNSMARQRIRLNLNLEAGFSTYLKNLSDESEAAASPQRYRGGVMSVIECYDQLSPYYHLLGENYKFIEWDKIIKGHALALNSLIRQYIGDQANTVLDAACGIGTQALGLAALGYSVTASDLAAKALARAKAEAEVRNLHIDFRVTDMRQEYECHKRQFDVVIACDNAIPHLLSDDDILAAFRQFYKCITPGGGCIISVRDYANLELGGTQVKTYGIRTEGDTRYLIFTVWDFEGLIYDLSYYVIEESQDKECKIHVMRAPYYAITIDRLIELMHEAGFQKVRRVDDSIFQPILIGRRS